MGGDLVREDLVGDTATAALIVTDATGSDRVVLADGVRLGQLAFTPTWSPDGRRLVYGNFEEDLFAIETVSLDGTPPERLGAGEAPAWSPDGASIACRVGPTGVWVMGSDGTEPHKVTTVPGSGYARSRVGYPSSGRPTGHGCSRSTPTSTPR